MTVRASGYLMVALPLAMQVSNAKNITGNEFNPAVSVILDGRYVDRDEGELSLPGFQLGGEAGLPEQGFSSGHNEISMSANIDDTFYGRFTSAIIYEGGETEIELEEAYLETLSLGNGFTVKAGRFFSGIGYLNEKHLHALDFSDRPLVYDVLLGGNLRETGLQAQWLAPTDYYMGFGVELFTGSEYPGGESEDNNEGSAVFVKVGDDLGKSSSWQLGVSYYSTSFDSRENGAVHHHGAEEGHDDEHSEEEAELENFLENGDVSVAGLDFIYKWAPNRNPKDVNFKLQFEYFQRKEEGTVHLMEGEEAAEALLDGEQSGFYVQGVYQFTRGWRAGLRYSRLEADNTFSDFESEGLPRDEFEEESGFIAEGNDPERVTFMIDYSPSHFSRIRLQYSDLDLGSDEDNIGTLMLHYTMSIGAHGAHSF